MSFSEIKSAIAELSPAQLAELSAYIQAHEVQAANAAAKSANVRKAPWPSFPVFDGGPIDGAAKHDEYLYGPRGEIGID